MFPLDARVDGGVQLTPVDAAPRFHTAVHSIWPAQPDELILQPGADSTHQLPGGVLPQATGRRMESPVPIAELTTYCPRSSCAAKLGAVCQGETVPPSLSCEFQTLGHRPEVLPTAYPTSSGDHSIPRMQLQQPNNPFVHHEGARDRHPSAPIPLLCP